MAECICVNTLGELANVTIPTGTQAAVVNQYNSTSAVSAALYVLVSGNPGHPLSIQWQSSSQYWTIHPDYISLEAAGAPAPGGDCSMAMANVLAYFAQIGRVALKLWERDYILNSLSSVTAPANAAFSIIGRGQTVSRLIVPYTNTSGALAVVFPDSTCQFMLRDFSVLATTTNPNVVVSCGTAIAMTVNIQGPNPQSEQYCGTVERIHIGPEIDPGTGNGAAYFSTGLNLKGISRPLVSATTVCGCDGPILGTDYSDSAPRYAMQTGIVVDECYSPQIINTRVWHATTGVSLNTSQTGAQGFVCTGSNIEGVRTGIHILFSNGNVGPLPNGFVGSNSIQFRDVGIYAGRIDVRSFPNNTFWLEGDIIRTSPAYDMIFQVATHVTITGSRFAALCKVRAQCGSRVNIHLDAETQINNNNYCASFLIDTNMFGAIDQYNAVSAIQATRSAADIQIGASNKFSGTYSGPVVDDASGTAVTQTGFPGTTAAPASVMPNQAGNAFSGPPTLGSANPGGAWPATYNVLHFVKDGGAPASPAAWGWVLYSSGGTLYAWNGTGKPVPLAS